MSINNLAKYVIQLNTYKFKTAPKKIYESKYEQDASNCRLYAGFNNLYCNLGLESNIDKVKQEIQSNGKNAQIGGQLILGLFTAKQYDNLCLYQIDIVKQNKLFVKLAKEGFVFSMSRRHNQDLKNDIKDDHIVQNSIKAEDGRHAINVYRDGQYFVELGNRGNSTYNKFKYTLSSLLGSIKLGTIKSEFYFIFYK